MSNLCHAFSGDHKASGIQLVSRFFYHPVAFPRKKGFVHLKVSGNDHRVIADLPAAFQQDKIILYDLFRIYLNIFTLPAYKNLWAVQNRQFIHKFFRLKLLGDPDEDIQDDNGDKQHIGISPYCKKQPGDQKVQPVKKSKDIFPDDPAAAFGDALRLGLSFSPLAAFLYFLPGQAC